MGISSIGVMANSLLLHLEYNKFSSKDKSAEKLGVLNLGKSKVVARLDPSRAGQQESSSVSHIGDQEDVEKGLLSQKKGKYSH